MVRAFASANVTVPRPFTFDHVVVIVLPEGKLCPDTFPFKVTELGSVMV